MTTTFSFERQPLSTRSRITSFRRERAAELRAPEVAAAATAPMRVSFAGGGSDLPPFVPGTPGRIVGAALDLRVRAIVEPFDRGWVRLELATRGEEKTATRRSDDDPNTEIAFRLLEVALVETRVADGVRVRVETDVAPGAGLGGSASAAVATLAALRASIGDRAAPEALANAAMWIEREGLRLACGLQDQIFASFGGVLDLEFDERGTCVGRREVPVREDVLRAFEAGLLLLDTNLRRVSGDVLGRVGDDVKRRTVSELVLGAADVARGFQVGDLALVLAGMRRSADAKMRRDPVACAAAAELEGKLRPLGAEVVRACGAGAGGHILVWAPREKHDAIARAMGDVLVRKTAIGAAGVRIEHA